MSPRSARRALPPFALVTAFAAAVAFASPGSAAGREGFRVEGSAHPEFPAIAGRIALLPVAVPPELGADGALWLDRQLTGQLDRRRALGIVPAATVRPVMERLGIDPSAALDDETRAKLAVELGVDATLEIRISDLARWSSERDETREGTRVGRKATDRARGKVVLSVVAASSGTMLAEGTAEGSEVARSERPLVTHMLDVLFERMFPTRGRR